MNNSLRIQSNVPAINTHRSLLDSSAKFAKTLEKVSSGLKINRGADGPSDLVISEMLRGRIASYTQAKENNEISISVAQTAEAAMDEANQLLIRMRQLAIHASNEGANDKDMLEADQNEIINSLEQLDRIAKITTFGSKRLLDGSHGNLGITSSSDIEFISAGQHVKDSGPDGYDVQITSGGQYAGIIGTEALTEDLIAEGETLKIYMNGKTVEYTTQQSDTANSVMSRLNHLLERNNMDARVMMDDNFRYEVKATKVGSDQKLAVFSTTEGVLSREAGRVTEINNGEDIKGTINGQDAVGKGDLLTGQLGTSVEGLTLRFKALDRVEEGQTYNAGMVYINQNSLRFQIGADYGETLRFKLPSTHANMLGRGVDNSSKYHALSDVDLRTFQGAQDALLVIDKARSDISLARAELGAVQRNGLEVNFRYLMAARENMIAAESIIRDADMAQEISTMTKQNIIVQTATAAQAQANRAPQNVLTLLQ